MKKLLLIVALLTISLTLTFAQDVTAKIVGECGTKFEVDLDAEGSGLESKASATIEIDASTGGREHTSEEDVYGYVKITGLDLGQYRMGWYTSADSWAQAWLGGFTGWGGWDQLDKIEMAQTLGVNVEGSQPLNPGITAKIIAGPLWIQFDGANYLRAERFLPDEADKVKFKEFLYADGSEFDLSAAWTAQIDDGATGRLVFGYDVEGMAGIQVKVSSPGVAADNTINAYGIGADVSISAVENLELSLGVYAGLNYETLKIDFAALPSYPQWLIDLIGYDPIPSGELALEDGATPIQLGVKVGYTIPLGEDMSIKPFAGVEMSMVEFAPEMAVTGMEIGGGVNLTWPGLSGSHAWAFGDSIVDYWLGWPQHYIAGSGIGLYGNYMMTSADMGGDDPETYNTVNLKLSIFDDYGDGGMIPMIGLGVQMICNRLVASGSMIDDYNDIVDLLASGDDADHLKNMLIEPHFGLGAYINTEIMPGVVPFLSFDYTGETADGMLINYLDMNIGAEITAIPNVVITLAWDGKNLMAEDEAGDSDPLLGVIRAWFRFKYY